MYDSYRFTMRNAAMANLTIDEYKRMHADMATKFDYGLDMVVYNYPSECVTPAYIEIETNSHTIGKILQKGQKQPIPLFGRFFYASTFDIKYMGGREQTIIKAAMREFIGTIGKNEDFWWKKQEVLVQRCEDGTLNIIFENGFYKATCT